MSKKFNLVNLFDENVSKLDTFEIIKIECSNINTNKENFFNICEVNELADSIDLIGLQQPLVVTKENNKYTLIAGHRRFEAVKSLGWSTVPCIVTNPINTELETLALIQTNTQTRKLTYYERAESVKRTQEALLSLKKKGYKFSGRLRDKISQITKESKTEIARMQAIDKNLSDNIKKMLEKGEISPSKAYEIQKLPKKEQVKFFNNCKKSEIEPKIKEIKNFEKNIKSSSNNFWEWKDVNEEPQNIGDIILYCNGFDDVYKIVNFNDIDNFYNVVESSNAQYWAYIKPPKL